MLETYGVMFLWMPNKPTALSLKLNQKHVCVVDRALQILNMGACGAWENSSALSRAKRVRLGGKERVCCELCKGKGIGRITHTCRSHTNTQPTCSEQHPQKDQSLSQPLTGSAVRNQAGLCCKRDDSLALKEPRGRLSKGRQTQKRRN